MDIFDPKCVCGKKMSEHKDGGASFQATYEQFHAHIMSELGSSSEEAHKMLRAGMERLIQGVKDGDDGRVFMINRNTYKCFELGLTSQGFGFTETYKLTEADIASMIEGSIVSEYLDITKQEGWSSVIEAIKRKMMEQEKPSPRKDLRLPKPPEKGRFYLN